MRTVAIAAVFAAAGIGMFAGGVAEVAHGHFSGSLPLLLIPFVWIGVAVLIFQGKRQVRSMLENISDLLQEVTQVLGATSTFPD
jgi:hypothetical protein